MRVNWGAGIAVVYTTFAVCTTGFVVFAMRQPVQLVSSDYYANALALDAHLEAVANAERLPDTTLQFDPGAALLTVTLPVPAGETTGALQLYRPSDATADRIVPLAVGADGRQRVALDSLQPGHWIARAEWDTRGRHYYRELRLRVR